MYHYLHLHCTTTTILLTIRPSARTFFSPSLRLCNTLPSITVVVVDVGSGHLDHCTLILLMRRCSSSSSSCTLNTQNYCLTISRDFSTRTSNTSTISWRESSGRRSAVSSLLLLLFRGRLRRMTKLQKLSRTGQLNSKPKLIN